MIKLKKNKNMKVEVSNGELLDKLSILEIKSEKITDSGKLKNVNKERKVLLKEMKKIPSFSEIENLHKELRQINEKLWDIEDELRNLEKQKRFDNTFIELARSVYYTNDQRSVIKKNINRITKSSLIEEKSYEKYS